MRELMRDRSSKFRILQNLGERVMKCGCLHDTRGDEDGVQELHVERGGFGGVFVKFQEKLANRSLGLFAINFSANEFF